MCARWLWPGWRRTSISVASPGRAVLIRSGGVVANVGGRAAGVGHGGRADVPAVLTYTIPATMQLTSVYATLDAHSFTPASGCAGRPAKGSWP